MDAEHRRLEEARTKAAQWKKWGPYLSERQWGTVREDYSDSGDAWDYFTHDQSRSRAYRWGEDGLAGISDDQQLLCFALALWNGKDPILKERMFGLTNSEANHGEDVKEYYFYLDSTPTHSYMKYLYKYPQAAYPYANLIETNRGRSRHEFEYELLDTGVFDQNLKDAVNPEKTGTKAAAHYPLTVAAGTSRTVRLRLSDVAPAASAPKKPDPFGDFDAVMRARRQEADEFYATVIPSSLKGDAANVMRQALAGMLWSKQYYYYDVDRWLTERGADPFKAKRRAAPRNDHWHHMYNAEILSMPDKWEYPWYAAWDLAFHVLALTMVDEDFGKGQLDLMLGENFLHPSGQLPAYEWNFGDVNPPVHAWSTIFTYRLEQARRGQGDLDWLERAFHKLLLNFTWWVNRKDRSGNNVFEGGFLGLDNIGVFDRSAPLPTGGHLEQADGTAWMALFCQNMLEISVELAMHRPAYVDMAVKFVEHFLWIASSMVHAGEDVGMWDEEDGFFYDVLRLPDGGAQRLKVRSMVGLLPLCAATVFQGQLLAKYPELRQRFKQFLESRPELTAFIHDPSKPGHGGRHLAAVLSETKLRRVLATMLDEKEFLSPYGLRSISRYHAEHPYVFRVGDQEHRVSYLPAESDTGMFGGNSNWRGPIWMPVNGLIIRALLQYHTYYGKNFTIECPTGSGRYMNLYQVAEELTRRLASIFLRDSKGRRPMYGGRRKFQEAPHWSASLRFFEYFHGDNGAGLGASHQTGWTGTIARAMHVFATSTAEQFLELGKAAAITEVEPARRGQSGEAAPSRKR